MANSNNTATAPAPAPTPTAPISLDWREFTARGWAINRWGKAGQWEIRARLMYGGIDPWKSWNAEISSALRDGKEEKEGTPAILYRDVAEEWYRGEEFGAQAFLAGALRSAPRSLRHWYRGVACHPYAKRDERNRALRAVAYYLGVSQAHAGWHAPHSLVNVAVAAGYRPSTPRPTRHELYPELAAGWEVVLD